MIVFGGSGGGSTPEPKVIPPTVSPEKPVQSGGTARRRRSLLELFKISPDPEGGDKLGK